MVKNNISKSPQKIMQIQHKQKVIFKDTDSQSVGQIIAIYCDPPYVVSPDFNYQVVLKIDNTYKKIFSNQIVKTI